MIVCPSVVRLLTLKDYAGGFTVTHTGRLLMCLPIVLRCFVSDPRTQADMLPALRGFVHRFFEHCLRNGGRVNSRVPVGCVRACVRLFVRSCVRSLLLFVVALVFHAI